MLELAAEAMVGLCDSPFALVVSGGGALIHSDQVPEAVLRGAPDPTWHRTELGPDGRSGTLLEQEVCPRRALVAEVALRLLEGFQARQTMQGAVDRADAQLGALGQTQRFLSEFDLERVLAGILDTAMRAVDAGAGMVLALKPSGIEPVLGIGIGFADVGDVPEAALSAEGHIGVLRDEVTPAAFIPLERKRTLGSPDETVGYLLVLASPAHIDDCLGLLDTVARLGCVAVDNATFVHTVLEWERLRGELEVAGQTQRQLLPRAATGTAAIDIAGTVEPCDDCGGDYFDVLPCPDGGAHVCVADVSGHGVGPALLMATTRGYVRALVSLGFGVGEVVARVNDMLAQDCDASQFVTLLLVHMDPTSGRLSYSSAGHEAAALLRPDGSTVTLEATSPPLGVVPGLPPEERCVDLHRGDLLVAMTDGLAETADAHGAMYGRDHLLDTIREAGERFHGARQVLDAVLARVEAFRGTEAIRDDATLVAARVRPPVRRSA